MWIATSRPLRVDEVPTDGVEVTDDDVEEARQNYLRMDVTTRAYVDALRRRFPDSEDLEDGRTLN